MPLLGTQGAVVPCSIVPSLCPSWERLAMVRMGPSSSWTVVATTQWLMEPRQQLASRREATYSKGKTLHMVGWLAAGHEQRVGHSTKAARLAVAPYRPLRMQRQPGELPESADGGGARAAAPAEAQDEQWEVEEQQADWGPGAPGAACPKGKKLSSTCSQDTSRAEGPMTAATGPRG